MIASVAGVERHDDSQQQPESAKHVGSIEVWHARIGQRPSSAHKGNEAIPSRTTISSGAIVRWRICRILASPSTKVRPEPARGHGNPVTKCSRHAMK